MMIPKKRNIIFIFLVMVTTFTNTVFCQEFTATHNVDPVISRIGDHLTYKIRAVYDQDVRLIYPVIESQGVFSVHRYNDFTKQIKDKTEYIGIGSFSLYETGEFVIPTMNLIYQKDRKAYSYALQPLKIRIQQLVSPNQILKIRDIKEPISLKINWKRITLLTMGVFVLLILISGFIYLYIRRKSKRGEFLQRPEKDLRSPYQKARDELEALKKDGLLESGRFKEYYHRLIDVLKRYLAAMYYEGFLEMTTWEVLYFFFDRIDDQSYRRISKVLNMGDAVKFAKYIPLEQETYDTFQRVEQIIEAVKARTEVSTNRSKA